MELAIGIAIGILAWQLVVTIVALATNDEAAAANVGIGAFNVFAIIGVVRHAIKESKRIARVREDYIKSVEANDLSHMSFLRGSCWAKKLSREFDYEADVEKVKARLATEG